MVKPKKHLGQHFLKETSIAENLAQGITRHQGVARVLEIGPGTGVLTRELIRCDFQELKLIEFDKESVAYLNDHHSEIAKDIIDGDFLKLDLYALFDKKPFILVGNFPYNISSQILFRIFENRTLIPEMVGMFQKEVAERVSSPEGSKKYGILSVLLQVYYEIDYLFTVHEDAFDPPPKVKSGVIRLRRNNREDLPISDSFFKTVVKLAFGQRRKTLRNSVMSLAGKNPPEELNETLKLRPEQLSPQAFIELATALYKIQSTQ
jgi:16S rRNA (adenine1518-N6/adenine1519-N6)-dimethyltransferase